MSLCLSVIVIVKRSRRRQSRNQHRRLPASGSNKIIGATSDIMKYSDWTPLGRPWVNSLYTRTYRVLRPISLSLPSLSQRSIPMCGAIGVLVRDESEFIVA